MSDATAPSKGYEGYGYKWWLEGGGTYMAAGIFGQFIFIDPNNDVVISMHSNAPAAVETNYHAHADAAMKAIAKSFGVKQLTFNDSRVCTLVTCTFFIG